MSTYRERREARAERLREWADKREAKAETAHATASRMGEAIPFGQPILVGHYSEGRDRNYRARMVGQMDRAVEHGRKAREFDSRAAGIDAQLATSIYSDDPDAIDALRARIAGLEAERARIKAYNATCRKGAPDLSILDDAQRASLASVQKHTPYNSKGGAFPAYALSNLSGNIKRNRDRLAQLEAAAPLACEHEGCDVPATHLSGIGNERPHQRLCPMHTNERVAANEVVWFRCLP